MCQPLLNLLQFPFVSPAQFMNHLSVGPYSTLSCGPDMTQTVWTQQLILNEKVVRPFRKSFSEMKLTLCIQSRMIRSKQISQQSCVSILNLDSFLGYNVLYKFLSYIFGRQNTICQVNTFHMTVLFRYQVQTRDRTAGGDELRG